MCTEAYVCVFKASLESNMGLLLVIYYMRRMATYIWSNEQDMIGAILSFI